jgi:MtN3 and saliva related transmembrane protein
MTNWIEIIGLTAAACTTISFVPQVITTWKLRSGAGLSLGMYLLFTTGLALWLAYGIMLNNLPIILANIITLALALSILGMKLYFADKDRRTGRKP